jgi:hypothetical protein
MSLKTAAGFNRGSRGLHGYSSFNHAYPVACQAGNLHTYSPFVYCEAAATFSAFGNQPDKHAFN